jgi:hypothetical protein
MARNRIIYASQSVWCNGEVLYRVQSLGSTTTFTSEDIFEIGHLDIIDVVDDVPAVAVTLNTNDFGDVRTLAILAQVATAKLEMDADAIDSNANLVVVSGTNLTETSTFYHGVGLPDFAITCGNLPGVSLWAPVQDECSLGTLADNIDQTMWMDEVYINSLEFSYTTGANATENYGAETDQKMWLLNDGRFVNYESFTLASGTLTVELAGVATDGKTVATLSDGSLAFLRKASDGNSGLSVYDSTASTKTNYPLLATAAVTNAATQAAYNVNGTITLPTDVTGEDTTGDLVEVIYAADGYSTTAVQSYFDVLDTVDRPDTVGALRQGQVEVYLIDPDETYLDWSEAVGWRFTSATLSADLTREALAELGHLGPFDRPLTLPIPITVTMDTTAGDLEHWARFAGKLTEYEAGTLDEIDLADLFGKENMIMVIKVYAQTDEEAGGVGADRKVLGADNTLNGQNYFDGGIEGTYDYSDGTARGAVSPEDGAAYERPLKTVIVEHLKITDEAYTLDVGANATQTFGFRSTNDMYVIKGELTLANITGAFKIRRNG